MNKHHSILATVTSLACVATLTLSGCGGGSSSRSTGAFCNTLRSVAGVNVQGTDPASIAKAADAFRKLAAVAPASIKHDYTLIADDETKVLNGDIFSVDESAAHAAGDHADSVASSICANHK